MANNERCLLEEKRVSKVKKQLFTVLSTMTLLSLTLSACTPLPAEESPPSGEPTSIPSATASASIQPEPSPTASPSPGSDGPLSEKNKEILDALGIPVSAIKEQKQRQNTSWNYTYTEIEFENGVRIEIDKDGEIIYIRNFKGGEYSGESIVNSTEDISDVIGRIEAELNIPEDYILVSSEADYEDSWHLWWYRQYGEDLYNTMESVRALICRDDKTILLIRRYDIAPQTTQAAIDEEEAVAIAAETFSLHQSSKTVETISVALAFRAPNYRWSSPREKADFVRLVYEVKINDERYRIDVDAVTGEVVGGDVMV